MENTEKQLAAATAHWLEYMSLSGYTELFSEAFLIIPVAEYFRGRQWKVAAEVDCYRLLKMEWRQGLAGYVNFDIHAERSGGAENVILEMKFMKDESSGKKDDAHGKRATPNYPRLISDFIKLAVPNKRHNWTRMSLVARGTATTLPPPWLSSLEGGDEPLKLKVERINAKPDENETVAINRIGPAGSIEPLSGVDKSSILNKLKAYDIKNLGLEVKRVHTVSMDSVKVFVFSMKTDSAVG